MLEKAAILLSPLGEKIVFTGGTTIPLYLDNASTSGIRPTKDVDCVVEITTRVQYYQLEDKLRALGLEQSLTQNGPICRWCYEDLLLDIMPTEESVLGFSNKWYIQGVQYAISCALSQKIAIWIFSSPYLLATKLEAYQDRGKSDLFTSTDIEDVIAVLDGCTSLETDWPLATAEVRSFLHRELNGLFKQKAMREVIAGQIGQAGGGYLRAQFIQDRVAALINQSINHECS